MRQGFLLFFFLLLLGTGYGWADCNPKADGPDEVGIATDACDYTEVYFSRLESEVKGVYVERNRMRAYLGRELLEEILADKVKRLQWVEGLRRSLRGWQFPIEVCTDGNNGAFPWDGSQLILTNQPTSERRHPWLRPEFYYQDANDLLRNLRERVIRPAERWRLEWKEMTAARERIEKLQSENEKLLSENYDLRRKLSESQQIKS